MSHGKTAVLIIAGLKILFSKTSFLSIAGLPTSALTAAGLKDASWLKIRGNNRAFSSRYNSKTVFLSGLILIFPLSGPAILSIINTANWILTAAGFIIAALPGKWMQWNFAGIRCWPCPIGGMCSGALITGNIKTRWNWWISVRLIFCTWDFRMASIYRNAFFRRAKTDF